MPAPPIDTKQRLVGFGVWKMRYELIPLVGFLGLAVAFGVTYSTYALLRKTDIRVISKKTSAGDRPPWEDVDPEKSSKMITINQKYERIPELDKLRDEIGSYKY